MNERCDPADFKRDIYIVVMGGRLDLADLLLMIKIFSFPFCIKHPARKLISLSRHFFFFGLFFLGFYYSFGTIHVFFCIISTIF